jgi:hypothetical protein
MILQIKHWITALALFKIIIAEPAPEITTVIEGYNLIAKLPCINCPFLYRTPSSDDSTGLWTQRNTSNALVISPSSTPTKPPRDF